MGTVIANAGNFVQEFAEDNQGQFRTFGREHEGFFGQGDHGMFELGFGGRRMVGNGSLSTKDGGESVEEKHPEWMRVGMNFQVKICAMFSFSRWECLYISIASDELYKQFA